MDLTPREQRIAETIGLAFCLCLAVLGLGLFVADDRGLAWHTLGRMLRGVSGAGFILVGVTEFYWRDVCGTWERPLVRPVARMRLEAHQRSAGFWGVMLVFIGIAVLAKAVFEPEFLQE